MAAQTMEIIYRCSCMVAEASFTVRVRGEDEDVMEWLQAVDEVMTDDHAKRSPACRSLKADYVKIWVPENAPYIGAPPKLDS